MVTTDIFDDLFLSKKDKLLISEHKRHIETMNVLFKTQDELKYYKRKYKSLACYLRRMEYNYSRKIGQTNNHRIILRFITRIINKFLAKNEDIEQIIIKLKDEDIDIRSTPK